MTVSRAMLPVVLSLFALAPAAGPRPNVLLLTLDTMSADRIGFLGVRRRLIPELGRLAAGGVVFEQAFAQAPLTTVSHSTVLSGTYPQFHRVNDFGIPLPEGLPYLPDRLQQSGWRTAAFL